MLFCLLLFLLPPSSFFFFLLLSSIFFVCRLYIHSLNPLPRPPHLFFSFLSSRKVDAVNAIVYPDHQSKAAVAQPPPPHADPPPPPPPPPPSPPLLPLAGEEAAMALPDGAPRGRVIPPTPAPARSRSCTRTLLIRVHPLIRATFV